MLGEATAVSPKKTYQSTISVGAKSAGMTLSEAPEQGQENVERAGNEGTKEARDPVTSPRKKAPRMSDVHEPTKKPVSAR